MGLTVLDAGVLIGFLDRNDAHHKRARQALDDALDRNDRIVLPASALAEILVGPLRRADDAVLVVHQVVERLPVQIAPLDAEVAATAAALRARHLGLKLPDALVIATAAELDADHLITSDRKWPSRRALGVRAALIVL